MPRSPSAPSSKVVEQRSTRGEWFVAAAVAVGLAIVLTWPIAANFDSAGRIDSADGRFSLWNVAWVARALATDPAALFDANIFYPTARTLAFSELNLLAGLLATPVWIATGNPYAALNFVILLSFALSGLSAYALARHLTGSIPGAALAGIAFAYCPFAFAHHAHVQLLMTFVLPLALLALHRFVERPAFGRATAMAGALILAALACGYYAVFAALLVATGILWFAIAEGRWSSRIYWIGSAWSAALAIGVSALFLWPYGDIRDGGFARSIDDSRMYSAGWRSYLASPLIASRWMLPYLGSWREVLFPGFLSLVMTALGAFVVWRRPDTTPGRFRARKAILFYVVIAGLAGWMSTGPDGGLYTFAYEVVPSVFAMMRAPARFGLIVTLAAAIFGAFGLAAVLRRFPGVRRRWVLAVLAVMAVARSTVGPLPLTQAPVPNRVYELLRDLPDGAVAEFPYFVDGGQRPRHTIYMLGSTLHWKPLINGYSDYIPAAIFDDGLRLATFPSADAWRVLDARRARYVVVHWGLLPEDQVAGVRAALRARGSSVVRVVETPEVSLFEIVRRPGGALVGGSP